MPTFYTCTATHPNGTTVTWTHKAQRVDYTRGTATLTITKKGAIKGKMSTCTNGAMDLVERLAREQGGLTHQATGAWGAERIAWAKACTYFTGEELAKHIADAEAKAAKVTAEAQGVTMVLATMSIQKEA